MKLTDAEFDFLDGYLAELFSESMDGPHLRALQKANIHSWDMAALLVEHAEESRRRHVESSNGKMQDPPVPIPWLTLEHLTARIAGESPVA